MFHAGIRRYLRHGMLPQLAVFEASARAGCFARAAEELHIAQPTVSTQIRKLTETIGLPLFEQVGRKIFLTAPGRELYAACQELFRTFSDVEGALADLRGLRSGRLNLAACTSGTCLATRLLAGFAERFPGTEVALHVSNRAGLIERLGKNQDDLYIFANPPTEHEVVSQAILPNPMVVFARTDHPLAKARGIPFARIAGEPFLMREPGSGTRMVAQQVFERQGLAPRVRMELSSDDAIEQAILAGLGVAILSRRTLGLAAGERHLAILDVEGFPLERHWHLIYPVGKQVSPVARKFMDMVRVEGGQLVLERPG
jgi:DNA-binding transcriptional LysR family regulator